MTKAATERDRGAEIEEPLREDQRREDQQVLRPLMRAQSERAG